MCNKALSFTFLSPLNSLAPRSGSLVLVSGLYFVSLQNAHVSGSPACRERSFATGADFVRLHHNLRLALEFPNFSGLRTPFCRQSDISPAIQGPRSNFDIAGEGGGGGGTDSDSILEGHKTSFLTKVFIILKILGGGHVIPGPPAPQFLRLREISLTGCQI